MTALGKAFRRKFNVEPTVADARREIEENTRLTALCKAKDVRIEQLHADVDREKRERDNWMAKAQLGAKAIDQKVTERCSEIQHELNTERKMNQDLRAIIETHNAANGDALRKALTSERDEAVRLMRLAREQEKLANKETMAVRHHLITAHNIIESFEEQLAALRDALGEKPSPYYQGYGS